MGWKHMPLARRVPGLTNTEKLVLITYAECANADDGDSTYIGQATIARELGKDRSDINKATKRLQELGYISKRPKYVYPPDKPPRRTSNTVTVHYNKMLEAVEAYQATLRVGKSATDSDDAWRTEIVDNSRAAHVENASSGNSTASDVLGLSQHGVGTIPTVRGDCPTQKGSYKGTYKGTCEGRDRGNFFHGQRCRVDPDSDAQNLDRARPKNRNDGHDVQQLQGRPSQHGSTSSTPRSDRHRREAQGRPGQVRRLHGQ